MTVKVMEVLKGFPYFRKVRVSQKFCNHVKHNIASLDAFIKVMYKWHGNVSAVFTSCTLGTTRWVCIYGFSPIWTGQIIEVLETRVKFLQLSSFSTDNNYSFIFRIANAFRYFWGLMVKFELVRYKFPNQIILLVYPFGFQMTREVKQRKTCKYSY